MSEPGIPRTLAAPEIAAFSVMKIDPLNLKRDIFHFVTFAAHNPIKRSHRENLIPKAAAKKIARLLSDPEEEEWVEDTDSGSWSELVGNTALHLGVVHFDLKGVYAGYSSSSESYPDNFIRVREENWAEYLSAPAVEKERRIVAALSAKTPNEFFHRPGRVGINCFSTWGSATGPASRMDLPRIRGALLELLADLPPDTWFEFHDFVEMVRQRTPDLILDPKTREPNSESKRKIKNWEWENRYPRRSIGKTPYPAVVLEGRYENFQEFPARPANEPYSFGPRKGNRFVDGTPEGFHRVEGRYLERFLCQVPFLAGFVDLAFLPDEDRGGLEVEPSFERLRAFRLRPRLRQVLKGDPSLNAVNLTVMPNFEVLIDAPSYPEREMAALEPYTVMLHEDAHTLRLRLDRKKVVTRTAQLPPDAVPLVDLLARLASQPLQENVRHELETWTGHARKLTLYENFGLVELRGGGEQVARVADCLGERVVEKLESALVVRDPDKVIEQLEAGLFFPEGFHHAGGRFTAPDGVLREAGERTGRPSPRKKGPAPREKATVALEDLAGLRCANPRLLKAVSEILRPSADPCQLVGDALLVIPASALPAARKALRTLAERFDVEI
ncbi:MAG: hypothetical protein KA419_12800 [Acidobacteria bacterium]|nr:hypothetical protein [Acidobacteriota bacterium]